MSTLQSLSRANFWTICLCTGLLGASVANSQTLTSGDTQVVLVTEGNQLLARWGLASGKLLPADDPVLGRANGTSFSAADLKIIEITTTGTDTKTPTMTAVLRLEQASVEFRLEFRAQGDTGVIVTDLECINKGNSPVDLHGLDSLACQVSAGEVGKLASVKSVEWNFQEQPLSTKAIRFGNSDDGRSSGRIAPWWSLSMPNHDMTMVAQFVYSGNWLAQFVPKGNKVDCRFGMIFDDNKPLQLAPGASFKLPSVAVAITPGDDLDNAANAHHRWQRQFVYRSRPEGVPLLVQFNTWYAYAQEVNEEKMLKVIPLAAKIGCEIFVIDAGWFGDEQTSGPTWKLRSGDWRIDTVKFPGGLTPIIKAANDHGMKFGLWLEPEILSVTAPTFRSHPEWCLAKDGKPLVFADRAHLDFSIPEVREYMTKVVEQLQEQGTIDWVKLDYNINVGNTFDTVRDDVFQTRLHDHLAGYGVWLQSLKEKYPNMIVENCSSGAKRWDPAVHSHIHSSWISDTVQPKRGPQLMWGSLLNSAPEMCNHWMTADSPDESRGLVGGGEITSKSPEWWEFMHVAAMGGQYGVSAKLDRWPDEAIENAKQCIDRYKQHRALIDNADVFHLTPQPVPGVEPEGWMAVEFLQPEQDRGLVLAFRLDHGPDSETLKLKGLLSDKKYRVTIAGEAPQESTGESLMKEGLKVNADMPWRSVWITIETVE